jgi:Ca-activated chloride channel family protein
MPLRARLLLAVLVALALAAPGCGGDGPPLRPRAQTWAELRVVRRGVTVTPAGEPERAPYPRERLADGEAVTVREGGLGWIRRDGGATLLVRGPARMVLHPDRIDLAEGRVFADTPPAVVTAIETPGAPLRLSQVRASIDADPAGTTEAYVLAGELRAGASGRAGAGERLVAKAGRGGAAPEVTTAPAVAWDDWTGGLGTTDRGAEPAPYGVGTVGARAPGEQGTPRFPLAIQKLDVRVSIDRDLAVTEVDETFFNPSSDAVEGLYRFRTPEGATLHRFGVDREGVIVWGRVKEKQQAAAQYQANVYQGSREDPALLEWEAPGVYRARLYPIGPGEARRVVVRYAEWLGRTGERGERRLYVYPMAAEGAEGTLPVIEELRVRFDLQKAGAEEVRVGMAGVREGSAVIVRGHDLVPRADLALELFDGGSGVAAGYRARHGTPIDVLRPEDRGEALRRAEGEADYVIVRLRPGDVPAPSGGLDLAIVVDTSAGTDPAALAVARAAVAALLAHLGPGDRAAVWTGDTGLTPLLADRPGLSPVDDGARRRILAALAAAPRGGATDLGGMVVEAAAALDRARRGAVVYVGDGAPTVGEISLGDLRARLGKLARPVRIFGLGVGDDANMALLEGLARGAAAERIGDGNAAARAALRVLEQAERPALLGASIDLGPSVERIFPRDLGVILADERLLVVGRATGSASPSSVTVRGPNGAPVVSPIRVDPIDDRGDLTQRWADGRLAQLLDDGAGRAAVVDLGMRQGIVTPFTSFYVPTRNEMSAEERGELDGKKAAAQARITRRASHDEDKRADDRVVDRTEVGALRAEVARLQKQLDEQAQKNTADPHVARQAALRDASEFGMIGLLNAGSGGDPNAPTAPWGRDDSLGSDPLSARGNVWGSDIGDAAGKGGLGLSGIGEGGGGRGDDIGLGSIGTIGHGAGAGDGKEGQGQGFGSGHGRLGGAHRSTPPQVRMGAADVKGRLPPEVVARVVRQSFGRFRLCYENGLRNNPNLQGRVTARFVVGKDGAVSNVSNGGSDMPDSGVVACVVRAFNGLSFPEPEAGTVTVTYPIVFSPEGGSAAGDDAAKEKAKPAAKPAPAVTIAIGDLPRVPHACGDGAAQPLADRVALWRERIARYAWSPSSLAQTYRNALASCEAPTWRERSRLLAMMLDAIAGAKERVALWKELFEDTWAAGVLYRGILVRARTPEEVRALHAALGLRAMDPGQLAAAARDARTPVERVSKLRALYKTWPDDFHLAVRLLDALEDAGDEAGARALARELRARPDADAALRTAVGELYLRLAGREAGADRARDEAEARRAFGEIVELAPDDPVARRRLGDLLRAHGWFAEAARQYETLARLSPDDPGATLLLAAADEGLGKLESAVKRAEQAGAAGDARGSGATARAFAATYLAWGQLDAAAAGRGGEADRIAARRARVISAEPGGGARGTRVSLTWAHPELHPTLWTGAGGSAPRVAPDGDAALGIADAVVPARDGVVIEVRIQPEEVEHAARLGASATLTVARGEGGGGGPVVRVPVSFAAGGREVKRFVMRGGQVQETTP